MLVRIDVIDIHQQEIGIFHQFLKLAEEWFRSGKWLSGSIDAGRDIPLLCLAEKIDQKINLQQRFSAADRDSSFVSPVIAVAECLFKKLVRTVKVSLFQLPGIRIVSKLASHGTAA